MKMFLAIAALLVTANVAQAAPEVCQVKINGQVTYSLTAEDQDGAGFFQYANQFARDNRVCVHAKIDARPNSGRVYSADGRSLADRNGQKQKLSNSDAQDAISRSGEGRCETISCIAIVDNDHPTQERPIQIPNTGDVSASQGE
jgi:hypothetical protein